MRNVFVFLCVGCVGLGACSESDTDLSRMDLKIFQDNKTGAMIFSGRPTKITDGDTIVLAGVLKIRMAGIDAPESRQRCVDENGVEYACGKMATQHLRQIIGAARVQCRLHGNDRYGRYIMTCHKPDGTDIHEQMVRDGYAVVSTYGPDTYLAAETAARDNKRGLWRGAFGHPYCFRHQKTSGDMFRVLCADNKYYRGWDIKKDKASK
ncbi:thermonuclease family protein [bacterium]|nr:thermonuclease family protein [bacterium]